VLWLCLAVAVLGCHGVCTCAWKLQGCEHDCLEQSFVVAMKGLAAYSVTQYLSRQVSRVLLGLTRYILVALATLEPLIWAMGACAPCYAFASIATRPYGIACMCHPQPCHVMHNIPYAAEGFSCDVGACHAPDLYQPIPTLQGLTPSLALACEPPGLMGF